MRFILGMISTILYMVNMLILACLILCLSPIAFLIPIHAWRHAIQAKFLQQTPTFFARANQWIAHIATRGKWDVSGTGELKSDGWYVMLSNHRSWIDIMVLGNIFNRKIPPLKFFMKKELLWQLPFAGLACYALGFPFMSRHSHAQIRKNPKLKGKDIETAKKACKRLRHFPSTLINFLEGTRFTKIKKERQNSPFKHLLKPHAGGAAVVINELHDILSGIINVVIVYPEKTPNMWDFMCGRFEKIIVRYEVIPITPDLIGDYYNDRQFRSHIQQWLNTLWERNDRLIEKMGVDTYTHHQ